MLTEIRNQCTTQLGGVSGLTRKRYTEVTVLSRCGTSYDALISQDAVHS